MKPAEGRCIVAWDTGYGKLGSFSSERVIGCAVMHLGIIHTARVHRPPKSSRVHQTLICIVPRRHLVTIIAAAD